MGGFETAKGKWQDFWKKAGPGFQKTGSVFKKTGWGIGLFFSWVYKLRRIFMTVPVAWAAVELARKNAAQLPEAVGVFIQSNGSYAFNITRQAAVAFPLGVTAACLLLMFCSKKPLYPWLISILTLVIPVYMMLSTLMPV